MSENAKFISELKIEPIGICSDLAKCEKELIEKVFPEDFEVEDGKDYEGDLRKVLCVYNRNEIITFDVNDQMGGFFYPIDPNAIVGILKEVIGIADKHTCKVSGKLLMMWDHNDFSDVYFFNIMNNKTIASGTFAQLLEKEMKEQNDKIDKEFETFMGKVCDRVEKRAEKSKKQHLSFQQGFKKIAAKKTISKVKK